jgi:hypothetical protein
MSCFSSYLLSFSIYNIREWEGRKDPAWGKRFGTTGRGR